MLTDLTKEELIGRLKYSEELLLRCRDAISFDQFPCAQQLQAIIGLHREITDFTGVPNKWLEDWKNLEQAMGRHIDKARI